MDWIADSVAPLQFAEEFVQVHGFFSSQSFWKRGSFRSGSNIGSSRSSAGVSGRSRAALQDGLVNLCFQGRGVVGRRVERSEERSGTRQVTLGLCDTRLLHERVQAVRYDIENLIKLSQRFGEAAKHDIGSCMLREPLNVARVEPLGFVEVRLAPVPLASPACDIGQRLRNLAAIRQELTCLLKVTHRGVVILQAGVVVKSLGMQRLAEIGLKSERGFGCLPCLFTQGDRWLKSLCDVADRIN